MNGMRPVVTIDGTAGIIVSGSGNSSLIIINTRVNINPEIKEYFPASLPFSDKNQIPWLLSLSLIYGSQKLPAKIVAGKTTTAKKG